MEQLIFVGIIVLFSILEAAARKGRGRQGGEEGADVPPARPLPAPAPRSRPPAGREGPLSYDEDPSYDDEAEAARPRTTSEGLIPGDVWEEIQRMARGDAPAPAGPPRRPVPAPRPEPPPKEAPQPGGRRVPVPRGADPKPTRTRRELPAAEERPRPEAGAIHSVHLTHPKYGTPVSGRLTGFAEVGSPRGPSQEARAVRRMLAGGPGRLREAIILQELLGPPLGLRDEGSRQD